MQSTACLYAYNVKHSDGRFGWMDGWMDGSTAATTWKSTNFWSNFQQQQLPQLRYLFSVNSFSLHSSATSTTGPLQSQLEFSHRFLREPFFQQQRGLPLDRCHLTTTTTTANFLKINMPSRVKKGRPSRCAVEQYQQPFLMLHLQWQGWRGIRWNWMNFSVIQKISELSLSYRVYSSTLSLYVSKQEKLDLLLPLSLFTNSCKWVSLENLEERKPRDGLRWVMPPGFSTNEVFCLFLLLLSSTNATTAWRAEDEEQHLLCTWTLWKELSPSPPPSTALWSTLSLSLCLCLLLLYLHLRMIFSLSQSL